MSENNTLKGIETTLKEFYIKFLQTLAGQVRLGIDAINRFLLNYQSRVIQTADSTGSIRGRHQKLMDAFDFYLTHKTIIDE